MTITNKLFNIGDYRYYSDTYIESGTCFGQSVERALAGGYPLIKSCELHKPYFDYCVEKFKGKNVELYLGKSTDQLHIMLRDVYKPAVILLDAHPAGEGTESHEEWLKGNTEFFQHTILTNELDIILEHRKDHILIIDDQVVGSPDSESYMTKLAPFGYIFSWFDEQLSLTSLFHKDKILVCIPN